MAVTANRKNETTKNIRGKQMLPPCRRLKLLRERANVTGEECARAWRDWKEKNNEPQRGRKTAMPPAATTWYRYESPGVMGDHPMPYKLIKAISPLLVGKGTPPITENELYAISELGRPPAVEAKQNGGRSHLSVVQPVGRLSHKPFMSTCVPSGAVLPIRYRAERGNYREASMLGTKSLGDSNLLATGGPDEFAVYVADDHAEPIFSQGTVLDCVAVADFSELKGKRVVALSERTGGCDLWEVVVANVESVIGSSAVLKTMDGSILDGTVVGRIRVFYAPT
jgi:hypothetical protein